jgi:conjugative transposon TraN protein
MKRLVCLICAIGFYISLSAQVPVLSIATNKTTSLVFPFSIMHVDRGTADILVQQVPEATNILLVKAAKAGFGETNLSIITEDGSLYTFSVCYNGNPSIWVYQLPVQKGPTVEMIAHRLLDNPPITKWIDAKSGGITARVTGIYIQGPHLFFQLRLQNDSPLDYEVSFLRLFLRDKKRGKRTAIQEVEYSPLALAGQYTLVQSATESVIVIAVNKFTIQYGEQVILQVGEKGGRRHLQLKVSGSKLLKGVVLRDLP